MNNDCFFYLSQSKSTKEIQPEAPQQYSRNNDKLSPKFIEEKTKTEEEVKYKEALNLNKEGYLKKLGRQGEKYAREEMAK